MTPTKVKALFASITELHARFPIGDIEQLLSDIEDQDDRTQTAMEDLEEKEVLSNSQQAKLARLDSVRDMLQAIKEKLEAAKDAMEDALDPLESYNELTE